jgi:hypothetical protein
VNGDEVAPPDLLLEHLVEQGEMKVVDLPLKEVFPFW